MNALQMGENISLVFTTVLDQVTLGLVDEDEDEDVADRSYWEKRGTKATVYMIDDLIDIIKTFEPSVELKYNKFYVKNQKTLWGSCSKKRNLNFNWRIMLLRPHEADYLIIHEF